MKLFNYHRPEFQIGLFFLGATISSFIAYMVCTIVGNDPYALVEVVETCFRIGNSFLLAGSITLVLGVALLLINAALARDAEVELSKGPQITGILLIIGTIVAILIFYMMPIIIYDT
ncbi:MAG: hypothetical protein ACFFCS_05945 [Candidatus Hodarchaeota archaeon]